MYWITLHFISLLIMKMPNAEILYSTSERIEMIEALRIVDEVVVYQSAGNEALEKIDFDILALGEDQKSERFDEAVKWCEDHGRDVVRLKRTKGISSADIKKAIR